MDRTGSDIEWVEVFASPAEHDRDGATRAAVALFEHANPDDVIAVYIVGGHRPSDRELNRLRRRAGGLEIARDEHGDIALRRHSAPAADVEPEPSAWRPALLALGERVRRHVEAWGAEFGGLTEGVR